ncbi:hypothetical protein E1B28_005562 [Marasmius oreades]|uniref:Uncharacterized protein n=1 Tax=Marasmius oreades TaxID=181124 RepID=A0A9P7UUY5_9AGAR|nr:uncharacterized protein E1B28_005562 [Marasmius oreades]KAG7094745.1 hypothetical protein E1B28_005562 [Marasmius oreades]
MFFRRSTSRALSTPPEEGNVNPDSTTNSSNEKRVHLKGTQAEDLDTTMTTITSPPTAPTTPNKRRTSLETLVTKIRLPRSPNRDETHKHSPKNQRIESTSGEEPISHPGLSESLASPQKASIIHRDTFMCSGGVNLARLLGMTRQTILERAEEAGANCLVEEKWKCVITGPRRPRGAYKVHIHYSAFAAKSKESDPHKPVALDNAQGVPGLMTILERQE